MASVDDGGIPWRSATLYAIITISLMAPLDVPFLSPGLPVAANELDIPASQASLLITVYAVPGVIFAPVLGMLADRIGRKRVIVFALLWYGTFGAAIAFTDDFTVALGLRFLQGCTAGSILASLAYTLVGDHFDGVQRDYVMGLATGMTTFAAAIYPAIGGALASIAWNAPFAAYGVSTVVGIGAFFALEESGPDIDGGLFDASYFRGAVTAVPARTAIGIYGSILAAMMLFFGGILTVLPFLLEERFGFPSVQIGLFTTAALLASGVVSVSNGRLSRRFESRTLIVIGFVAYGIGFVATGVAPTWQVAFLGVLVFGVGHGLVLPSVFSLLVGVVPTQYRAGAMSLRTSVTVLAQAVGPVVFISLGGLLGYRLVFETVGIVVVAIALVIVGTRFGPTVS